MSRARRALRIVGAWTLVAAFFSAENAANHVIRGQPVPWFDAAGLEVVYWIPWALLTPVLLWTVRRWRLDRGWGDRAAVAGAGVPFAIVQSAAALGLTWAAIAAVHPERLERLEGQFWVILTTFSITAYWKYWAVVAGIAAVAYGRELRQRQVEAARLETRLSDARLHALRMRLQPHFLFNTLHSVSMLNLKDAEAANRLLVRLSDLLRATLATAEEAVVPLEREIALVDRYLEIESIRIGDRLSIEWDVDEAVLDAEVPTLILQPIAENAIRHGIAPSTAAGRLVVRARRERDDLLLEVIDDGGGFPDDFDLEADAGVGLGTTKARVERLYEARGELAVDAPAAGGARVWIRLPYRRHREGS